MDAVRAVVAVTAGCILLAGCNDRAAPRAGETTFVTATPTPTPTPTAAPTPTPRPTPTPTAHVTPASPPPFRSSTATVTAAQLGKSWHAGCPLGPSSLRALTVTYWGFDR